MVNVFTSPEIFQAHATIDAGMWMLVQINKELSAPQSPINAAVDAVTGYGKARRKELAEQVITILTDIIAAKKFIGADYAGEVQLMKNLKKFI